MGGSGEAITRQQWFDLPREVTAGLGVDMPEECLGLEDKLGALPITGYPIRALAIPQFETMLKLVFKEQPTSWNSYGDGWLTMHAGKVWILISPTRSKEFGGTVACVIGSLP